MFLKKNTIIHTNMPRNCMVFLIRHELTWRAILWSQIVHKTIQFRDIFAWILYSTFKTSFWPYAFHNKRLQTLFIDQIALSKATCSFTKGPTSNTVPLKPYIITCLKDQLSLPNKKSNPTWGCGTPSISKSFWHMTKARLYILVDSSSLPWVARDLA